MQTSKEIQNLLIALTFFISLQTYNFFTDVGLIGSGKSVRSFERWQLNVLMEDTIGRKMSFLCEHLIFEFLVNCKQKQVLSQRDKFYHKLLLLKKCLFLIFLRKRCNIPYLNNVESTDSFLNLEVSLIILDNFFM